MSIGVPKAANDNRDDRDVLLEFIPVNGRLIKAKEELEKLENMLSELKEGKVPEQMSSADMSDYLSLSIEYAMNNLHNAIELAEHVRQNGGMSAGDVLKKLNLALDIVQVEVYHKKDDAGVHVIDFASAKKEIDSEEYNDLMSSAIDVLLKLSAENSKFDKTRRLIKEHGTDNVSMFKGHNFAISIIMRVINIKRARKFLLEKGKDYGVFNYLKKELEYAKKLIELSQKAFPEIHNGDIV